MPPAMSTVSLTDEQRRYLDHLRVQRRLAERTLTLYFDNDTLVRTDGNFMKETPQELLQESHKYGPLYPSNLTKEQQKELEKKQQDQGGGG